MLHATDAAPHATPNALLRVAALCAVALPPLFAGLGAGDCEFHMEVRAIESAQETFFRLRDDPRAWLLPTWNGQPRVNKPPLAVWVDLAAWSDLDPEDATVDALVRRARRAAAALAVLLLAGVFATGTRLKDASFGALAAAATGTSLLFLRQARLASYDTYFMVFAGLAVCAALLALAAPPRARFPWLGWLLCGVALGLAVLSKGPLAYLLAGLPIAVIAVTSAPRARGLAGTCVALLVSVLVAAPWYLHVLQRVPDAAARLLVEYEADRREAQPFWYYAGLVGLIFPWCLWLPAALVRALRRPAALAWPDRAALGWFACVFVVLSLHEAKQQRYITAILPAAGWLVAWAWLAAPAAASAAARRLACAHWLLLFAGGVAFGVFGAFQSQVLARGWIEQPELAGLPAWLLGIVGLALAAFAAAGFRHHAAGRRELAAWLTAAWMSLASTPGLYAYAHSHHARYAHRADAERVAAATAGRSFHHLADPATPAHLQRPPPAFLLYARRIVPPLAWPDAARDGAPGWLMAPRRDDVDRNLREAGWTRAFEFDDGSLPRVLYRR